MSLFILAAAGPVEGRTIATPLPPVLVQAEAAAEGVLVSWLPPIYDGGQPVQSYAVYRLTGLTWSLVGTAPADATQLLDDAAPVRAIYQVEAVNDAGASPPSQPTTAQACPIAGASVDDTPPFVHPIINKDCITGGPCGDDLTFCIGEIRVNH